MTKILDWLAEYRKPVKAFGLVWLWLISLVMGFWFAEWLIAFLVFVLGGWLFLLKGFDTILEWWEDERNNEIAEQRHEEQMTKAEAIATTVIVSEQNVIQRIDQLEAKLAQPTKQEILELPISKTDKEVLSRIADLSSQGDAEAVLRELEDDSKVKEEIEALAINMAYRHFFRGNAYAQQGKYLDSISSYERSLNYRRDSSSTWTNLGSSLESVGRYAEALQSYEEAIKYDSNSAIAWYNRGTLLGRYLGEYKQAIVCLDKAIEINSDFSAAFSNRGMAHAHIGQLGKAILDYDRALKIDPDYYVARYNRGVALANLGHFLDALIEYNIVVKFAPDLPDVWLDHGVALASLGRYDEAIQSFDEAIKYHPNSYHAFYNRGVMHVTLKEFEKAKNSFKQALVLAPENWQERITIEKQIHDLEREIPKQD